MQISMYCFTRYIKSGKHIWQEDNSHFCKCYNLASYISYVLKEVWLLNYAKLLQENTFPLTSKQKLVLLAVVCDIYIHHCEYASYSNTNVSILHSCNFWTMPTNSYLAPKFFNIPVSIEQYLLCGCTYHSITFWYRLTFVILQYCEIEIQKIVNMAIQDYLFKLQ